MLYDMRGHGKSEGLRGYVENTEFLLSDLDEFTKLVDSLYEKTIPRFFIGHSLGILLIYIKFIIQYL